MAILRKKEKRASEERNKILGRPETITKRVRKGNASSL